MTPGGNPKLVKALIQVGLAASMCAALAAAGFQGTSSQPGRRSPESMEKSSTAQPPRKAEQLPKHSEIKCTVLAWDARVAKPALSLVCPPKEVFSPIRVYLKFSWKTPEDIPKNFSKIEASAGTQTKIRPATHNVFVWLKVTDTGEGNSEARWVSFNLFDGIRLEGE